MSKRKPPKSQQMGLSGVSELELPKLRRKLQALGATEVEVSLDEDTMAEFPHEGRFYIVDYKR